MQICKTCNKSKSYEEFHKHKRYKSGYRSICIECTLGHKPHKPIKEGLKICKTCNVEKGIDEFQNTSTKGLYYKQSSCRSCRSKNKAISRKLNPSKEALRKRAQKLRSKYGIELEDYDRMYDAQVGLCKICKEHLDKLNVDHCHNTGKIRGLLCFQCNSGLGQFRDNINYLKEAIKYLEESR